MTTPMSKHPLFARLVYVAPRLTNQLEGVGGNMLCQMSTEQACLKQSFVQAQPTGSHDRTPPKPFGSQLVTAATPVKMWDAAS